MNADGIKYADETCANRRAMPGHIPVAPTRSVILSSLGKSRRDRFQQWQREQLVQRGGEGESSSSGLCDAKLSVYLGFPNEFFEAVGV
jgi:hypothetical protein